VRSRIIPKVGLENPAYAKWRRFDPCRRFGSWKQRLFRNRRMRSALTHNFSDKYTTPCASNIPNGLGPAVIVRRANLTNHALLSCSDSLRRRRIDRRANYPPRKQRKNYEYEYKRTFALASPKTLFAPLARGDSTLVRYFQSVNWINNRVSRSLVCHLADHLGKR
jgi:hypothetical protein